MIPHPVPLLPPKAACLAAGTLGTSTPERGHPPCPHHFTETTARRCLSDPRAPQPPLTKSRPVGAGPDTELTGI